MSWAELGGEELGQVTVGVAAAVLNGSVHSAVVSECFSVSDTRRSVARRSAVQKAAAAAAAAALRQTDLVAQLCTLKINIFRCRRASRALDACRSRHLRVVRDGFVDDRSGARMDACRIYRF